MSKNATRLRNPSTGEYLTLNASGLLVNQSNNPVVSNAIKVYRALLSQLNTGDPVAIVRDNTFGADIVWARTGVGNYTGTLAGAFPASQTYIQMSIQPAGGEDCGAVGASRLNDNKISIRSMMISNGGTVAEQDSVMSSGACFIEILVYP